MSDAASTCFSHCLKYARIWEYTIHRKPVFWYILHSINAFRIHQPNKKEKHKYLRNDLIYV